MKKAIDQFSKHAGTYKKYRPTYPRELYEDILKFVENRDECWDCGTGNGQVAMELSKHFKQVYATDISQNQINNAHQKANVLYSIQRAEKTSFSADKFDLITVGQAVHWFDFEKFNKEVKRVAKNGGIVSIWGYGLLRITEAIDKLIAEFYTETVDPYWSKERRYLDNEYESIPFDFKELSFSKNKAIVVHWGLNELEGYFNSWSSVQNFQHQNDGKNPVNELIKRIDGHWPSGSKKEIKFPLYLRIGRVEK